MGFLKGDKSNAKRLGAYELALEISPVPLMLASADGQIALANTGFHELFGYEPGELIGTLVEQLVPPAVRGHHPELREAYHRVPTKRSMGAGRDLFGVNRQGDTIPLELGLEPVTIGEETWSLVAAIDIRQRKTNEQRLHQALDAAACGMVMSDDKGIIIFANKEAATLFGYDEREMIGLSIDALVPPAKQRAHAVYRGSYNHGSLARRMAHERAVTALRRDGSEVPVEISLTPVPSDTGFKVMSTITDLTTRLASEAAIREKTRQLELANQELSQFAYSASHDLKAPLATLLGLLNLAIEDLDDGEMDELRSNLGKAVAIGERSAEKVESVLRIARAGRDPLEVDDIDLAGLVEETWEDIAGAHVDATTLSLQLDHVGSVVTERPTLTVILENLLSNAFRYRDPGKERLEVTVKSVTDKDMLRISVTDNGRGIADKNHDHVFRMFKRIDQHSGDGIGLALVKKHVTRLGGHVSFESVSGVGATFHVTIPQTKEET